MVYIPIFDFGTSDSIYSVDDSDRDLLGHFLEGSVMSTRDGSDTGARPVSRRAPC